MWFDAMDPRTLGGIFGALIGTLFISRVVMWIVGKFMPDTLGRIATAYSIAIIGGVTLAAFGRAAAMRLPSSLALSIRRTCLDGP